MCLYLSKKKKNIVEENLFQKKEKTKRPEVLRTILNRAFPGAIVMLTFF